MQQIKEGNDLGPSWVAYGKKLKDGYISPFWHMKFYVLDGNHRAKAKELLGYTTIDAVIPKSHLERYRED